MGVGWSGFAEAVHDLSFREMMFEAAMRAYEDAGGLDPRKDVDAFVSCQEDYWEGIAISDEFAPDPVGGAMRSVYTVAGDGLQGLAQGYAMVRSGLFDVVVVEAHGKPSDIETLGEVISFAMDPVTIRPLSIPNPHALAALEASAYMRARGLTEEHLAMVVEKAMRSGLSNPRARRAARASRDDYWESPMVVEPLREADIAGFVDAAIVVVLASGDVARRLNDAPVWVEGVGWSTETGTWELHDLAFPRHAHEAASMAYRQARVDAPRKWASLVELDNRYSFKELQFLEALGLTTRHTVGEDLANGAFSPRGELPVNPSGGALAEGVPLEAHGLARVLNLVEALRDGRGERGIAHSWRGVPTSTSAVALLAR